MTASNNDRESGARVPRERRDDQAAKEFSQDSAKNKKPLDVGLTDSADEENEKFRQLDNRSGTAIMRHQPGKRLQTI